MVSILPSHLPPRVWLPLLALPLGLLVSVCPAFAQTQSTQWTTFRYDALGRVTRITYPDGSQTRACYDVGVTVAIDANQHKTRTTRDAYGRVVKVEEYTGTFTTCQTGRGTPYATTTYSYDRLGNLVTVTDALGNKTTVQYDTLSRKTQMRDPDLGAWTYQYDLNGNLTRQTDAKNQQIHFRYDSLNRRVQKDYGTQKALGSGDVRYTYDGSSYRRQGRLAKVVDSSGTTAFRYDAVGRVTQTDKVVDGVTYTTATAYDGLGRVTAVTYPQAPAGPKAVGTQRVAGVTTTTARLQVQEIETLAAAGNTSPAGLWSDGTTLWVVDRWDLLVYAYDLASRVRKPGADLTGLEAAGNTRPRGLWSDGTTLWIANQWDDTVYAYDLASKARAPAQDITGLAAAGNVSAAGLWSDGTTLWVVDSGTDKVYAYDLATQARQPGKDIETLKAAGNTSPTGVWGADRTVWVADDTDGKLYAYGGVAGLTLESAWTPEADKTYTVRWSASEATPRETAIETPAAVTQAVTFTQPQPHGAAPEVGDQIELMTTQSAAASRTVTYTYTGPQLQKVQEGTTTYAHYSGFNALGQPSTLTLGNGVTTTYTYDAQNYRLKTLKTVQGSTVLQDLGYTFDKGGNMTKLTDGQHGTQTFSYDALDRLTEATNGATGGYGTLSYTYNPIGNLLSHSKVGTYTYNASGATSTRPHAVASTRLTTGTGSNAKTTTTPYSYDANGNLSQGAGRTITWDAENRPTQIVKDGVTTTFVYDGDGGRVKKTVNGTTTVYIGQLYVCEDTACARLIYAGAQRVALVQVNNGATSYFQADHLGSTSVLTDSSGTAEEHNSYLPYGGLQTHTGTSDVAYKYTGQERDASTGWYFYQTRYYAQGLGRFVSPDPIVPNVLDPQAFNRYAYARNNPVRYVDPTGQRWGDPPWPGDDWRSWPEDDWRDFGPWDDDDFGRGYSDPGAGYIDPSTGVYTLPTYHSWAMRLPPESLFPTPFGPDPWRVPPASVAFVTRVAVSNQQNLTAIHCTSGSCPALVAKTSHASARGPRVTFHNKSSSRVQFILQGGRYGEGGPYHNPLNFVPDMSLVPILFDLRPGQMRTVIPYGSYPSSGGYFMLQGVNSNWTGDIPGWVPRNDNIYP